MTITQGDEIGLLVGNGMDNKLALHRVNQAARQEIYHAEEEDSHGR